MNEIRNIERKLRCLTDRELLEILDHPGPAEPRQLSLALVEADHRGGVTSMRARVELVQRVTLKCIGYWKDREDSGTFRDCPEPYWLRWPRCDEKDSNSILAYLETGHKCRAYCGRARCRFPRCGLTLGSKDLTDGEWVWPEGLEHYIVRHSVSLPDEFRARVQQRAGVVAPADPEFALRLRYHAFDYDVTFWVDWCRKLWTAPRGVG